VTSFDGSHLEVDVEG